MFFNHRKYCKLIFVILSLCFLYGCSTATSYSGKPLVNNDIREIDLISMGSNKYSLLIRGNVLSEQSELRAQLRQEISGICGANYEVISIDTSEVEHMGHKKPILESVFLCL